MAEVRSVSSTGAEKGVKPQRYDLIPPEAITELARLYGVGARKYADHNFRKGYEWSKSYGALQRHANLFWSGETIDQEMFVNHMASVAWHAFALTEFYYMFPNFDDRIQSEFRESLESAEPMGSREFPAKHQDDIARPEGEVEPRFDLIPLRPLALLAEFYGSGAATPVSGGRLWSDDYAKIQEHANLFWAGSDYDPSSGFVRTVHIAHHALSIIELCSRYTEYDDRLVRGAAHIGFDSTPKS